MSPTLQKSLVRFGVASGLALSLVAPAVFSQPSPTPRPLAPGLATAHEGNSLTDHMTGIVDYARSMGFEHKLENFTAPGSPPRILWARYVDGKHTFLSDRAWDILSVQPFGYGTDPRIERDVLPIASLYREAIRGNPRCRLHILAQWPSQRGDNPDWEPVINSKPARGESWETWRYPLGSMPYYKHLRDLQEENFGLRFVGYLYCRRSGEYRFTVRADDGAALSIDDKLVVESKMRVLGGKEKGVSQRGQVTLDAGYHAVTLVYWQRTNNADLRVQWLPPGGAAETNIPDDLLFTERPSPGN